MNFDGLPGPTHNYSGLAHGNLAAERNAQQVANPREAALQGLAKMRALAARGFRARRAAAARAAERRTRCARSASPAAITT